VPLNLAEPVLGAEGTRRKLNRLWLSQKELITKQTHFIQPRGVKTKAKLDASR
jgi:hypothetical protein